jgi:hypothetical protein
MPRRKRQCHGRRGTYPYAPPPRSAIVTADRTDARAPGAAARGANRRARQPQSRQKAAPRRPKNSYLRALRAFLRPFPFDEVAAPAMAKSSIFFPPLIAVVNHRGFRPRPAQVSAGFSGFRYLGATRPLAPPRPDLVAFPPWPPNCASLPLAKAQQQGTLVAYIICVRPAPRTCHPTQTGNRGKPGPGCLHTSLYILYA